MSDAARAVSYLFSVDPFKRRLRDFSVRTVFAGSADNGVSDAYLGLRKKTVFSSAYFGGDAERTLAVQDNSALRDIAAALPYDFILVLANARRYGGSALFGGPAVVAIDNAAARYLVLHEFAHVMGGLADEYYVPRGRGPDFVGNIEPWHPNVTISRQTPKWLAASDDRQQPTRWNKAEYEAYFSRYVARYFALRSAYADEDAIEKLMVEGATRTAALLDKNAYRRKAGLFEGANGFATGVFRSEVDCIMFSYQTRYFCTACSHALEQMIDAHCA
jgi:hypothetical protein